MSNEAPSLSAYEAATQQAVSQADIGKLTGTIVRSTGTFREDPHDLVKRLLACTTPLEAMGWAGYIRSYAEYKAMAQ